MKKLLLSLLLVFSVPAAANDNGLHIKNPWVREAPPVASVNAGFFTLCNDSKQDTTLVRVTSPAFDHVQMHETIEKDGKSSMHRLEKVEVAAGKCVDFKPGARHLMLFDPVAHLKVGDTLRFHFYFSDNRSLSIGFPVLRNMDSNKMNKDNMHGH